MRVFGFALKVVRFIRMLEIALKIIKGLIFTQKKIVIME